MTVRALLVDDEAPARSELRYLLQAHAEVKVVGEAASAAEAIELTRELAYDVVFLDVEMPGAIGLETAPHIHERPEPPAIVFVTAHAEYAVDAFAVEAFDYLLKPVDPERLARVVERLRERSHENAVPVDKVPVVAGGGTELLDPDQIHYAHAEGDYSRVHTYDRTYLCTSSLGELEGRLGSRFARIHRSYLVNLAKVAGVRRASDRFRLQLTDESRTELDVVAAPVARGARAPRASRGVSGSRGTHRSSRRPRRRARRARSAFRRCDCDPHGDVELVERSKAVEVGHVVAGVQPALQARLGEQRAHGGSFRRVDRRHHFEHEAAPLRAQPLGERVGGNGFERPARGLSVGCAPVVERRGQRLHLQVGPAGRPGEPVEALGERGAAGPARARAGRRSAGRRRRRSCVQTRPCGRSMHATSPYEPRKPLELALCLGGNTCVLRPLDDRSEHAVDVQEERRPRGLGGKRGERVHAP